MTNTEDITFEKLDVKEELSKLNLTNKSLATKDHPNKKIIIQSCYRHRKKLTHKDIFEYIYLKDIFDIEDYQNIPMFKCDAIDLCEYQSILDDNTLNTTDNTISVITPEVYIVPLYEYLNNNQFDYRNIHNKPVYVYMHNTLVSFTLIGILSDIVFVKNEDDEGIFDTRYVYIKL